MQDPSLYAQINPTFPEHEHLKCPRCDSPNTKFCYYNNYNLSQPRFFCKSCKRYWTKGGSLRNIPVGGASRKSTKRSSTSKKPSSPSPPPPPPSSTAASTPSASSTTSTSSAAAAAYEKGGPALDQGRSMLDMSGNFGTLLGSSNQGQFGNLINGSSSSPSPNGLNLQVSEFLSGSGVTRNVDPLVGLRNADEGSSSCWNGENGWPDLSIYPPGSSYP